MTTSASKVEQQNERLVMQARNVGLCYNKERKFSSKKKSSFWALKDISFDLYEGDCLGIIGRNGAGKSSLLRVLAGIHKPDRGTFDAFGNSVALLTIGAGFMNNLSGRDNMILSAQLLGLSKSEIKKRLPKMIEYAELGHFINEPIYKYSTGMRARLGFSVAVQSDPKVLLIDETLGVGDAAFADKSSRTIQNMITSEGKTVILISHNPQTIEDLTTRLFWLKDGESIHGDSSSLIKDYLHHLATQRKIFSNSTADDSKTKENSFEAFSSEYKEALEAYDLDRIRKYTDSFKEIVSPDKPTKMTYIKSNAILGNFEEIIAYINEDSELSVLPGQQNTIGFSLFACNRLEESIDAFCRTISDGYTTRDVIMQTAYICALRGQYHETVRFFESLLVLDPNYISDVLATPIHELLKSGYQAEYPEDKEHDSENYKCAKRRAYKKLFSGDFQDATALFKKLRKFKNYLTQDQLWEARILRICGQTEESQSIFDSLRLSTPHSVVMHAENHSISLAINNQKSEVRR